MRRSGGICSLRGLGSLLGVSLVVVATTLTTEGEAAPPTEAPPTEAPPTAPTSLGLSEAGATDPEVARLDEDAERPAIDVRLAPAAGAGVLGAWLVAGPFKASKPALDASPLGLVGVDDKKLTFASGTSVGAKKWTIVSSGPTPSGHFTEDPGDRGSRTVDLKASLGEEGKGADLIAYAAGRLHVEKTGKYFLMLGVDDGVRVSVDGRVVFTRDDPRPVRDDDDILALALDAGDHEIVLKLHQREGAWAFRAKILDAELAVPRGAYLHLPGTSASDAAALAARMSWLIVDRAFEPKTGRYKPVLTVRYPEGAPRGVVVPIMTKLINEAGEPTFDLRAGGVSITSLGVSDVVVSLPAVEPWLGTSTLESTVGGRVVKSTFVARPASEQALVRTHRALEKIKGDEPWLVSGSLDSVRFLMKRLARFVARGDSDSDAQLEEAKELDRLAANLEKNIDPYEGRSGMMRRAVVTPFDGSPSELGLYVPPSYKRSADGTGAKKYPLIIGLHGMNSYPISMMRALFGLDEEKKEPYWKDRRPLPAPPIEAFVITPYAHGNTMYREVGEDDVMFMKQWMQQTFPIDETRITLTGPSMGGIGAVSIPFHYPHVFAAAEPLCGYHSYMIRADIGPRPKRPWERLAIEERSNVYWAENGEHLPLYVVHGTKDLPETNSYVLIDRYEQLKYSVKHEHPDAGHNVWGVTYQDLKGMKWLLNWRLDPHPSHVRFRTMRTRYNTSAWVTLDALKSEWGDVDARVRSKTSISLTTTGVSALTLGRDEKLLDGNGKAAINVSIDGKTLAFDEGEPLVMHQEGTPPIWQKGPGPTGRVKTRNVTGPIRDVFHDPLLFVYGADDGANARANERVARFFANPPGGIPVSYPVMSDTEFLAQKEPLAHDRALFLVGRTNKVTIALAAAATNMSAPFPIQIEDGAVVIGGKERVTGLEVGAAFVHPNPLRPDRAIVVMAGTDSLGMLRAMSLPELLPDFVVWDEKLAPARGQMFLGAATVRAAGVFKNDWTLPSVIADPFVKGASPPARPPATPTPTEEPTATTPP